MSTLAKLGDKGYPHFIPIILASLSDISLGVTPKVHKSPTAFGSSIFCMSLDHGTVAKAVYKSPIDLLSMGSSVNMWCRVVNPLITHACPWN